MFILQVSQWYELVVFTASMEIYGAAVADKLDNNRGILKRRYYRQVSGNLCCLLLNNGVIPFRTHLKCGTGVNKNSLVYALPEIMPFIIYSRSTLIKLKYCINFSLYFLNFIELSLNLF